MKTLYSQLEEPGLELAYLTWMQPNREGMGGEAGPDREPALPPGYVHIRSAIQALIALTGSPGCTKLGDRSRAIPTA